MAGYLPRNHEVVIPGRGFIEDNLNVIFQKKLRAYPFTARGVTMRESARKNRVRYWQTTRPR